MNMEMLMTAEQKKLTSFTITNESKANVSEV